MPSSIKGVDLAEDRQLALLDELKPFCDEFPYVSSTPPGARYVFDNPFFSHGDALFLYSLLRKLQPARLVEVGSGFSSALVADTNETCLNGAVELTFVEPYPDRLESLFSPDEMQRCTLMRCTAQDAPATVWSELSAGDVLFIDSTHVSKLGSDVNHFLFEVLPSLPAGVWIHIHDIYYPFEYPLEWVEVNRAWNESYILRAFLQYNDHFSIRLWNNFLAVRHAELLRRSFPAAIGHPRVGGSIWLEKVR